MKKRNIIDRLANYLGYVKAGVPISVTSALGLSSYPVRKIADYINEYKGWVYACVKARTDDVKTIRLRLYRTVNRKTGEAEEITDHEALTLLHNVNPWQTFSELIEATQAYKDLAGEAFWLLVKNTSKTKILQIWLLRPEWVDIKTSPTDLVAGYIYNVHGSKSGDKFEFGTDEVIHFKTFNPLNQHRGLSIIQAAAMTVDTDNFAENYNRSFFQNSALPAVVLKTDQKLDQLIINRTKAMWDAAYGGTDKAGRTAILDAGLDISPFTVSQKEMEFLAGQGFNRDKIMAIFKTPKSVLGMTEDVTVSNAEATDYIFAKRTVKPLMQALVDTLNEFLLPQYGDDLFFEFDDPSPENQTIKNERYKTLFSLGAITPNEVRQAEGLDEVIGLDNFYLPLNLLPVGGDDFEETGEPVKYIKPKYSKHIIPAKTFKQRMKEEVSDELSNRLKQTLASRYKKKQTLDNLGQCKWPVEKQLNFWKAFVSLGDRYEKLFKTKLREIFDRQEKETLERLDKTTKAFDRGDIAKVLFSLTTENKVAINILLPVLKEFLEENGNATLEELGIDDIAFDTSQAIVRQFFSDNALRGIKATNRVTKARLRKVLANAVEQGQGIPEIKRAIKNVFTEASSVRAERIARTEVLKAGNFGTLEAYKQSGVVVGKQWLTAEDEFVCQWCAPLNGKVISLDDTFFDQGSQFVGKDGGIINFKLDSVPAAPLHPNCRCTIVPITISQRQAKPVKKSQEYVGDFAQQMESLRTDILKQIDEKTAEVEKSVDDKFNKLSDQL